MSGMLYTLLTFGEINIRVTSFGVSFSPKDSMSLFWREVREKSASIGGCGEANKVQRWDFSTSRELVPDSSVLKMLQYR